MRPYRLTGRFEGPFPDYRDGGADKDGVVGNYDKRSAWAFIIAEALNAYFIDKQGRSPIRSE